ncbi:MAG: PD-(D/E)XK nuclease family protein [Labilithrix sp.]|nr:PD-(D/E)XK nuclease family protein [Labilithrix sp.]
MTPADEPAASAEARPTAWRSGELVVVPTERHVERLARDGQRGETRASLRARLAASLLPGVRFADAREARLTLAVALEEAVSSQPPSRKEAASRASGQLGLFGAAAGGGPDDPLLATLRGRGGASWVRAVTAIDDAIGALRSRGATELHLERVRGTGVAPARARTLAAAMRALDDALARAGARDGRLVGPALATAVREAGAGALEDVLGARHVRARWLLVWDPHDLAWWRALDETLGRSRAAPSPGGESAARRGPGFARVVLPAFDKRLEGARERDPLEVISDAVARHLDAAPESEIVPAVLGDLGATPPRVEDAGKRLRLLRAADARSGARAVADLVRSALDGGARVERVAIVYPQRDERTLVPLRRALAEMSIVFHDALGPPPSSVPVVAAALHALAAAESLDRLAVARLLRSGYIDAPRVLGQPAGEAPDFRAAERSLGRVARALETRATAAGADEVERLVRTGAAHPDDEASARRVAGILARARAARTRGERVRAAQTLFRDLGFGSRAGRGALATFARDEAPSGVERLERLAIARDVRAWDVMEAALDVYATTALRDPSARARPLDAEVFRLELTELLDGSAVLPNAGRAGAVRIARLADLPGDELDLLVVLDANDGVLPRDVRPISLVSEALEGAVARAAREAFVPLQASELAARDLAALAAGAAESAEIVLVTTAEDAGEAPASPSRVFVALARAGVAVEEAARAATGTAPLGAHALQTIGEIERRAARERAREGFFLDPARPQSALVGNLTVGSSPREAIARIVSAETGSARERALAVTSIERFAQCAFKGYAHVVLAAREGEEQRELPDAREEGNLGHTALAAAFLATREEWPRRPRDAGAIVAKGLEAADAALAASAGHAPLRAIVRLRVRESVRAVLARALGEDDWDFTLAEQAFGDGKPWPPLHVSSGALDVWLRGSIDRVDRAHGRAAVRVIDYKRSKSTVRDASSLLGETALQVPIYALVAAQRLEAPATGAYVPIQPRDLATETKANTRAEDRVGELSRREAAGVPSEIERRVLQIAVDARSGRFAPVPAREAECTHCSVSGGCRKPRFAMAPADDLEDKETP